MKTFEELKERITPEFIKKLCELAEGFELQFESRDGIVAFGLKDSSKWYSLDNTIAFSTLLHRAVEGWNNSNVCRPIHILCNCICYITDEDDPASIEWGYDDEQYQPCHLTACEMAILDCLLEVLR